ncbi:acyltransferase [Methanothrix sp.]|uniref:acyltransferase n=1 Tax=Methanothrix sp. TaxID=90426 RepID=UPI003BB69623
MELLGYFKHGANKLLHILIRETPSPEMRSFILRFLGAKIDKSAKISYDFLLFDGAAAHNLVIGKNVAIGPRTTIITHSDPSPSRLVKFYPIIDKEVIIEEDVWIGANVTILPGVRIGRCSVVAAGSVVTKDVKPFTIVAGSPARPIKQLYLNL